MHCSHSGSHFRPAQTNLQHLLCRWDAWVSIRSRVAPAVRFPAALGLWQSHTAGLKRLSSWLTPRSLMLHHVKKIKASKQRVERFFCNHIKCTSLPCNSEHFWVITASLSSWNICLHLFSGWWVWSHLSWRTQPVPVHQFYARHAFKGEREEFIPKILWAIAPLKK